MLTNSLRFTMIVACIVTLLFSILLYGSVYLLDQKVNLMTKHLKKHHDELNEQLSVCMKEKEEYEKVAEMILQELPLEFVEKTHMTLLYNETYGYDIITEKRLDEQPFDGYIYM